MLTIRQANLNDVPVLHSLIQEMAEYEHLPFLMTEQILTSDGFGAQARFRVLIAEFDHQPAVYAFFFDSYSTFQGRSLFLEDLFVRPQFRKNKVGGALFITRRSYCPRRKLLWSYATCPRLERNCDPVLQKDECHFPGRLENRVLEGQCFTAARGI